MSKKIKELRQRLHAGIPDEAKAIRELAEKENRALTDDEVAKVTALAAEKTKVQQDLDAAEVLAKLEGDRAFKDDAPSGVVVGHNNNQDRPWANNGEFFGAVARAYTPNAGDVDPRLFSAASGMQQAIPSEGGFLVPPEFSATIWDGINKQPTALLPMTDSYAVSGESLSFNANAETSRATGSRYGGVQGYWLNEADQVTKSKPKFRLARVEPQELAVLIYATDKLLANAGNALQTYLERAATDEINFLVGDAIINGTGVGKPSGILASGCLISVTKETSQANTTFNKKNVNKMWQRLHPNVRNSSIWLMNPDVEPQLDEFSTTIMNVAGTENVGGIGSLVYNAEKNTLKGRPIVFCEFCPTLGTVGDVILADMKSYLAGYRAAGIQSAMSMHVRFEYNETAFRFKFAVDGQTWLASALTPYKGSNTLSTFVALASRP
jgi:HK97 family phage major capsid protein